jgi:glutamate--cysteine ligase
VGLLYDAVALDAAKDLIRDITVEELEALRRDVPRLALRTPFRGGTLRDLALRTLAISAEGLRRRARLNANQVDERMFLEPLLEFATANQTPAERKLELYYGPWQRSVDPVFREFAY